MLDKEKLHDNLWSILFFAALLLLTILIILLIGTLRGHEPEKGNIAGGVFIGSVNDGGWNQNHYEGLLHACETYGLTLLVEEYVDEKEEPCRKAVDSLVEKGASVIFLTSDDFGNSVRRVIEAYPDVVFYTTSPEAEPKNATTYYGRMYQIRYLSGMLAGQMTETNVLGYVAAKDNTQVVRGINAYLLGARAVNPEVVLKVRFIGAWFDQEKERAAARSLIEEDGADVLAYHMSTPNTLEVAEEKGVKSFGYNSAKTSYSENCLAYLTFHWEKLYQEILKDYLKGSTPIGDIYWKGTMEGAVSIDNFSPLVTDQQKSEIRQALVGFEQGRDVFLGEIRRSDGLIMCHYDERISDRALLFDMKWFVEGVEVHEE